jgi:precorrin-3B synthase
MVSGSGWGLQVSARDAVEQLLDLAHQFLTASEGVRGVWHVRDLSSWATSLPGVRATGLSRAASSTPLGAIAGAASVQVPLALLTPAQAATVEACAAGPVVITPSRGLVLPGAAARLTELVAAGLVDDPASPWSAISACVRAPSANGPDQHARVRGCAGSVRVPVADAHQWLWTAAHLRLPILILWRLAELNC